MGISDFVTVKNRQMLQIILYSTLLLLSYQEEGPVWLINENNK